MGNGERLAQADLLLTRADFQRRLGGDDLAYLAECHRREQQARQLEEELLLRATRRPRRALALLVIALAVLIRIIDPAPLQQLRLAGFDLEQRLVPRKALGDASPVRIVQIDDESIAKYGQWPWPRTLTARLVDRIAAAQPRVLGIDILFAAPDRTSPPMLARELPDLPASLVEGLAQLPSNESRLAQA